MVMVVYASSVMMVTVVYTVPQDLHVVYASSVMMVTVVYTYFCLLLSVRTCPPMWALLKRASMRSLAAVMSSAMNVPEAGGTELETEAARFRGARTPPVLLLLLLLMLLLRLVGLVSILAVRRGREGGGMGGGMGASSELSLLLMWMTMSTSCSSSLSARATPISSNWCRACTASAYKVF